ncbi:hypothetical protein [Duganella levis]|uniref:Uncharacterized protein n=1 Tax=Duganella levis TaxID=2692169 RepID=A0ABW9VZ54_9BURK|nr:hypothetical protein [Duganella levis]MYN26972.1 hypothetical protein [Duganella levis]
MTTLISAAAHAAFISLTNNGQSIKRSRIAEVLAGMLGYHSYAALVLEERDESRAYHLDDAEMLVLNLDTAQKRALAIGVSHITELIQACVVALTSTAPVPVYKDLPDFYDDYAREVMVDAITNSDDVSAAMSETNASFDSEAELPYKIPPTENLWEARVTWSIDADGDMAGDHDFDGDRMFTGDTLNCRAKLTFDKAGRAGLILNDCEGYAGVNESWRDLDHSDEAAYLGTLRIPT